MGMGRLKKEVDPIKKINLEFKVLIGKADLPEEGGQILICLQTVYPNVMILFFGNPAASPFFVFRPTNVHLGRRCCDNYNAWFQ